MNFKVKRYTAVTVAAVLCLLPALVCGGQQAGSKWALVICGHPGDDEHRAMFAETIEKLVEALSGRLAFPRENIRIQFGSEPTDADGPAVSAARGKGTREELEKEVLDLRQRLRPQDTLWTIVLGHAHYDGRDSYLNLVGADMHQDDFAKLFAGLATREQVFFISTPASGFFIRPLAAKGRVVITATEADREINETLFPAALAEVLTQPPDAEQLDADGDGQTTLLDLYIAVTRNVAQRYVSEELLSTEHAQIDDNGDGRGTELQLDYLTEEQGGRAKEGTQPPKIRPSADGALAAQVRLRLSTADKAARSSQEKE